VSEQLTITEPSFEQHKAPENSPMRLLSIALENHAAIDVIERLAVLQKDAMRWEAEVSFNEAMNAAQSELGRIAPDLTNPQTKSRYASYAALDRKIRPIYVKHGLSLSFTNGEPIAPEMVRVICYVSRGGYTRTYQCDMPADGKGAKGGDVMTKTHASGAASSYGMRYLLKMIFNIAIGEDDVDGNDSGAGSIPEEKLVQHVDAICAARNDEELKKFYLIALNEAQRAGDRSAQESYSKAKNRRYREIHGTVQR
jgi:hypothetical protein